MKAVILAGGYGTRISEESQVRPKPMVEIGGMPILWHIMKIYSSYGIDDFIICCGYKGYVIRKYFADYAMRTAEDVTFDMRTGEMEVHRHSTDPWRVTLAETGLNTMTGGRIKRVREFIGDEPFCCTYGDGVSDIDIGALVAFHEREAATVTMTAVQPPGRFGAFALSPEQTRINSFREKPDGDGAWINGGFFVMSPSVMDEIAGDDTVFERDPLEALAKGGKLAAFRHDGFWQPMDTLRDKMYLEKLWDAGDAPWTTHWKSSV